MKFAPVLPIAYAPYINTGYSICFSELALQYPSYADLFRVRVLQGQTVLMDGMVFESKGKGLDLDRWIQALELVQPTIATVPDVWCDHEGTMEVLLKVIAKGIDTKTHLMAVAQGRSTGDCVQAVKELSTYTSYIGLKVHLPEGKLVDRVRLMHDLDEWGLEWRVPRLTFHMLGGGFSTFPDAVALRNNPYILGIDSAKPVSLAINGHPFVGHSRDQAKRPDNFWLTPFDVMTCSLMRENIEVVSRLLIPPMAAVRGEHE